MKLLLDENLPKRLKVDLMEFEVSTVSDNGWAGKKKWRINEFNVGQQLRHIIDF
jgi:predicted nuclease of predicted toxin-antitoxin system